MGAKEKEMVFSRLRSSFKRGVDAGYTELLMSSEANRLKIRSKLLILNKIEKLRTRSVRIRIISQLQMQVKIPYYQACLIYQVLASKIKELKILGFSNNEIASRLNINKKTVVKGLNHAMQNKQFKD